MLGDYSAPLERGTWMHKPGSKGGGGFRFGGSKWNRRHVWIENNAIHYGPAIRKPEKTVSLSELKAVRVCNEREINDEKGPQQYVRNGWRLSTHDKVILFVTEQPADRDLWVDGLSAFLNKTRGVDTLDEDDELTYRQIQESSRAFDDTRSRTMSMYSNANFNSLDMDEDEENQRIDIEASFRKELAKLKQLFYDEMDGAITRETRSASQMRARSQSMSNRSSVGSPSGSPNAKMDDVREQEDTQAVEREEARQKQVAAFLEATAELLDVESAVRLQLVNDNGEELSKIAGVALSELTALLDAEAQRRAAALSAWTQSQEEARLDLLATESEGRQHLTFSEDRDRTDVNDAKIVDRTRADKKFQIRIDGLRREHEASLAGARTALVQAEVADRKAMVVDESGTRAESLSTFRDVYNSIAAADTLKLQDLQDRHEASLLEARRQLFIEEESQRDDCLATYATTHSELGEQRDLEHAAAQQRATERVTRETERINRILSEERQELVDDEIVERNEVEAEARDQAETLASSQVTEARSVMAVVAKRLAAEAETLRQQQHRDRVALCKLEATNRGNATTDEARTWEKSIFSAAQTSLRKAEHATRERQNKLAAEMKTARRDFLQNEQVARLSIETENTSERSKIADLNEKNFQHARRRLEHRLSLQAAARTHEESSEATSRHEVDTEESSIWTSLHTSLSLVLTAMKGHESLVSAEANDRVALQISMDCGAEEAEEAATRREQRAADDREAQRLTNVAWDSKHNKTIDEEAQQWRNLLEQHEESLSEIALCASRRVEDAHLAKQLAERKGLSRNEVEARMELEDTEDTDRTSIAEQRDACTAAIETQLNAFRSERASLERELNAVHTTLFSSEQSERDAIADKCLNIPVSASPQRATSVERDRSAGSSAAEPKTESRGASAEASPTKHDKPQNDETSSVSSLRHSASRRQRSLTVSQRQEAAAQAAEAHFKEERSALEKMVTQGSWMYKPGSQSSGSVFRFGGSKWNKRYVWIQNNAVYYGERKEKPEKPLPFKSLRMATVVSTFDAEREGCPKELRGSVWRLAAVEKTIFFACSTERERNDWVKYLEVVTGQTDMSSTITSLRSFAAANLTTEETGWAVSEGEDDYDEEGYDFDNEDQEGSVVEEEGGESPPTRFVPTGASMDHATDEDYVPQTFEEWCALLQNEEREDRSALQAAQDRYRDKIFQEAVASPKASTLSDADVAQPASAAPAPVMVDRQDSVSRRERSSTVAKKDDATQKRIDAAAAAALAETAERERIVSTGAWMYKPRSKSNTSSSLMRSISSIGGSSWNKRYVWVDLKKSRILYGEKPGKPEKEVPLKAIQSIYPLPPEVMNKEGAPKNLWTLGFKITADDRTIYWAAPDAKVRKAFIDFLTPSARRQPSGLQARAPAAYASINHDEEEDEMDNPFDDDDYYDEEEDHGGDASTSTSVVRLEEVAGGPVTKSRRGRRGNLRRVVGKEPQMPLMAVPMFLTQINELTQLRRDEGLVGVAMANGEGLPIKCLGEVDATIVGRLAKLSTIAQSMRDVSKVGGGSITSAEPPTSSRMRSSTLSNNSGSWFGSGKAPRSILIEVEGPHHHLRTISYATATPAGDVVCIAIHDNPHKFISTSQ